jgi:hypothetical protein
MSEKDLLLVLKALFWLTYWHKDCPKDLVWALNERVKDLERLLGNPGEEERE